MANISFWKLLLRIIVLQLQGNILFSSPYSCGCPILFSDDWCRGLQTQLLVHFELVSSNSQLSMRTFPQCILPREWQIYNYRLSQAGLVVENAFAILSSQSQEVEDKCVKATCALHNFIRRTAQTAAVTGSIPVGEVEPLPFLGRLAASNSAREAIRVREGLHILLLCWGNCPVARHHVVSKHTQNSSFKSHPLLQIEQCSCDIIILFISTKINASVPLPTH